MSDLVDGYGDVLLITLCWSIRCTVSSVASFDISSTGAFSTRCTL